MARSNYIYLAFDKRDFSVCGAWTVKHEMLASIGDSDDYYLFRVPDGEFNPKVTRLELTFEKI